MGSREKEICGQERREGAGHDIRRRNKGGFMLSCLLLFGVCCGVWFLLWYEPEEAPLALNAAKIRQYLLQERIRNMDRKPITMTGKMEDKKERGVNVM